MQNFKEIVQQFEKRVQDPQLFPAVTPNLYEPCRYLLALGAKRVRPALCIMSNEVFGEINEDAWNAAAAIELFHNFTLIHDDIMDKAPLRRGNPTIHAKYGLTAGILSGDVMCIYAYAQLAKIQPHLQVLLELFNTTAIEVCEGQQMDMDFEQRDDVSIDEYIHMITLKTSVLLACSLKMGAILGGATVENAEKLYEFGKNVGIAFQLQDDYLDAFGDTEKLGKQNGGDIIANKKTYLLLNAFERANTLQHTAIEALLKRDDATKVPAMLSLYTNTGADVACREAVAHYSDKAFANLEDIDVPDERKQPLYQLASYLLQRDK
ncbi:MAG: polyprenyl synthetase family protein [Chitinophagales bacterium]|nr:polyprenyl synthetase family protein [Chitinophagales bacterium]